LYSGAKAVVKEALKTVSNIITDIVNKEPEQPVGVIFKNRFSEAKCILQEKNWKDNSVCLGFKKEAQVEKKSSVSRHT